MQRKETRAGVCFFRLCCSLRSSPVHVFRQNTLLENHALFKSTITQIVHACVRYFRMCAIFSYVCDIFAKYRTTVHPNSTWHLLTWCCHYTLDDSNRRGCWTATSIIPQARCTTAHQRWVRQPFADCGIPEMTPHKCFGRVFWAQGSPVPLWQWHHIHATSGKMPSQ